MKITQRFASSLWTTPRGQTDFVQVLYDGVPGNYQMRCEVCKKYSHRDENDWRCPYCNPHPWHDATADGKGPASSPEVQPPKTDPVALLRSFFDTAEWRAAGWTIDERSFAAVAAALKAPPRCRNCKHFGPHEGVPDLCHLESMRQFNPDTQKDSRMQVYPGFGCVHFEPKKGE